MSDDTYTFSIAGRIGTDVTYRAVADHLLTARLAGQDVCLVIDSPGGDVAEALAVHQALRSFDGEVTAHIRVAASAGAIIALGADRRVMAGNGWVLLHPVAAIAIGTAQAILAEAARLTRLDDTLAEAVSYSCGMPLDQARELVTRESWLDAEQALRLGLVHDVSEPVDPAPSGPDGDQYTEAGRRQSLARSAITPRTADTLASNAEAFAAVVATVPAIASAEPTPLANTHRELEGLGEIERRRREAIQAEAQRVFRLSSVASYRAGAATWTCQACRASNSHHPGAGMLPSPCIACRSTGITPEV